MFIEANVKKWGLAPMTGSLAPPPPYGSEQGSILLEGGREGVREGMGFQSFAGHGRSFSQTVRLGSRQPTSPGPQRSPTDISLAQLSLIDSNESHEDVGEGTSGAPARANIGTATAQGVDAPPKYESPEASPPQEAERILGEGEEYERTPLLRLDHAEVPIPTYDAAIAESSEVLGDRERSRTR